MIVTIEQINSGVIKYIDAELGAKAVGLTKFMVYFIAPSIPQIVTTKINQLKSVEVFKNLFDENGNVNLDNLRARAMDAIKHSGKVYIQGLDYFVDETDIEKLYTYIKNS